MADEKNFNTARHKIYKFETRSSQEQNQLDTGLQKQRWLINFFTYSFCFGILEQPYKVQPTLVLL